MRGTPFLCKEADGWIPSACHQTNCRPLPNAGRVSQQDHLMFEQRVPSQSDNAAAVWDAHRAWRRRSTRDGGQRGCSQAAAPAHPASFRQLLCVRSSTYLVGSRLPHQRLQTQQLKMTEVDSLTGLEARSPRSGCQQGRTFLSGAREIPFLASSTFWRLPVLLWPHCPHTPFSPRCISSACLILSV